MRILYIYCFKYTYTHTHPYTQARARDDNITHVAEIQKALRIFCVYMEMKCTRNSL